MIEQRGKTPDSFGIDWNDGRTMVLGSSGVYFIEALPQLMAWALYLMTFKAW
jgi:hypothetical protein